MPLNKYALKLNKQPRSRLVAACGNMQQRLDLAAILFFVLLFAARDPNMAPESIPN